MNLDEFLYESKDLEINMLNPHSKKSNYFEEFLKLLDNEYLVNNVLQSEFKFFCESRLKKMEIDGEEMSTRQKLQYTDYFTGCMTNLPDSKEKYIEETWNMMHQFFNNASKSKSIYSCIKHFIKMMMIFSPPLRTEMIMQIFKFGNNDIIEERIKVWQSMAIMSNYVMIEESFFYYFLNYIYTEYNSPNNDITVRGYASFVFVNAIKNRALDDRSVVPTINQIRSILRVFKLEISVYFDDEKFITMPVEIYQTIEELKQQIFSVFKWKEDLMPFFAFYEVKNNEKHTDENFVENFVRVSDVLASWELAHAARNFMPFGDEVQDEGFDENYKLYLRPRYYHPQKPLKAIEQVENTLLICELVRQMRLGRIIMEISLITHAVAVYCSMKLPETTNKNLLGNVAKIKRLISYLLGGDKILICRVLYGKVSESPEEDSDKSMKEGFSEILSMVQDYDIERKKKEFLGCFKKNPCFKSQMFAIKFGKEFVLHKNYPALGFLYISPTRIGIINKKQKHFRRFKYENIKSISLFKRNVVLIINQKIEDINDNEKNEKIVFEANQAENIYKAIQNYVSLNINGYYKEPEIKYDKIYEDQEDMVLDFELLDHLLDPSFALENTNRYHKKKQYDI